MQGQFTGGGWRDRVALIAAASLLGSALAFGGGSRGAGDLVVHLVALPALVLAIARWRHRDAAPLQRGFLYVLAAAAALMLLQLLPLPAALAAHLPQRAGVIADLGTAQLVVDGMPLTLDQWGTVRALLALMVFAASWMLASTLTAEARTTLLKWVLLLAFIMALLGFAQAAAGRHSSLRLFDFHHPVGAIGTFSNRNHFADLMALLIPFALCMGKQGFERHRAGAGPLLWAGLTVVLFLAAALSFSRTGFALSCAALVAGWLVQPRHGKQPGAAIARWAVPAALAASCVLAVAYYAWQGIVQRLERDPLEDLRWQYLANGIAAMRAQLPWGSGFGSFRDVYAPFEPVADMGRSFALHAHNDVLEVALEGGVPGLLLVIAAVGLIAWAAARVLANRRSSDRIATAATVAAAVPLLHSFVDYPLRTLAIACVFGLVLAVLFAPAAPGRNVIGGH